MWYFRVSLQSVQKTPYYSYWRQQNCICSCTVKLQDIVKVNKTLQMLLYYVTEHIISNLVFFVEERFAGNTYDDMLQLTSFPAWSIFKS